MKRSEIYPMPQFFDRYINLVRDIELLDALEENNSFTTDDVLKFAALKDMTYARDKWTIKDILQHIIDTERILSYRAMRFSRKDKSILPGFDEVLFGATANAARRTIEDLVEEYQVVRKSSVCLFKSFSEEHLQEIGICFNVSISVLALGFNIAGHQIHHMNIIRDRYFPLISA